jgi:hypothetical protein
LGTLPVVIASYRLAGFGQGTIGSYLRESEIKNPKKVLDEGKRQLQVIIARKSKGPPTLARCGQHFRYEPAENTYYCPEGKPLRYRGLQRSNQGYAYEAKPAQCQGCPQKKLCTPAPARRLFVHWHAAAFGTKDGPRDRS